VSGYVLGQFYLPYDTYIDLSYLLLPSKLLLIWSGAYVIAMVVAQSPSNVKTPAATALNFFFIFLYATIVVYVLAMLISPLGAAYKIFHLNNFVITKIDSLFFFLIFYVYGILSLTAPSKFLSGVLGKL
jgi:hypothetical protein